jgi:hypothetical protein
VYDRRRAFVPKIRGTSVHDSIVIRDTPRLSSPRLWCFSHAGNPQLLLWASAAKPVRFPQALRRDAEDPGLQPYGRAPDPREEGVQVWIMLMPDSGRSSAIIKRSFASSRIALSTQGKGRYNLIPNPDDHPGLAGAERCVSG